MYTALRLVMFVACYALLGAVYIAIFGKTGALVWPFIAAVLLSSALSLKYLAPQRQRFAAQVEARANRATANFEKRRAKEDVD